MNAEPEREHVCFSLTNEAGEVDAVVHGDPNMSPEALAALEEVVAAAKRQFEADLAADPSIGERQAAARARNRARLKRLARQRRARRLCWAACAATLVGAVAIAVIPAQWVPATLLADAVLVVAGSVAYWALLRGCGRP